MFKMQVCACASTRVCMCACVRACVYGGLTLMVRYCADRPSRVRLCSTEEHTLGRERVRIIFKDKPIRINVIS